MSPSPASSPALDAAQCRSSAARISASAMAPRACAKRAGFGARAAHVARTAGRPVDPLRSAYELMVRARWKRPTAGALLPPIDRGASTAAMPKSPDDLTAAVAHFHAGRRDEALALAAEHEIENAVGTEHVKRSELDAAEHHYRRAIALSPGFFKPHNNLGNVLRERGRLEE